MMRTTLKNPHGLTQSGHLSTAHDMAILGRHLYFDFPEYWHMFSRVTTRAMGKTIYATNRRLLRGYRGADGIKTGFTSAAGYNLVGSARRGEEHIIAVVFGGASNTDRYRRITELLDIGFQRAPSHVAIIKPSTRLASLDRFTPPPFRPTFGSGQLMAQGSDEDASTTYQGVRVAGLSAPPRRPPGRVVSLSMRLAPRP